MNKVYLVLILIQFYSCGSGDDYYSYNNYYKRYGYLHYIKPSDTAIQISKIHYVGANRVDNVSINHNIPLFVSLFENTHIIIETNKGSYYAILQPKTDYRTGQNYDPGTQNIYTVKESNFNKHSITNFVLTKIDSAKGYFFATDTLLFK